MRKRDAVNLTLEQLDREAQKEQAERERLENEDRLNNARPFLIKRIGIGLLDFLFAAVVTGLCFLFTYFVLFEPLGYNAAAETIVTEHENSGLFILDGGDYIKISDKYDNQDPVEYYDKVITNYYTTDERAISTHQLEAYIQAKLDSTYFVLDTDNNCVPKEGIGSMVLKETLEPLYTQATEFFYQSPTLNEASKTTYYVLNISILVCITIGSVAMYIVVPLIDKKRRTLAYIIGGFLIVKSNTMEQISLTRAMLRNGLFILLIYICAFTLYILTNTIVFSLIPLLVNTILMSLFHTNNGFHDIVGECSIINKSRSNALSALKEMNKNGEQQ